MTRSIKLDAIKGVGILLVIIYHSIGKNIPDALVNLDNGLFNMIACFFMQMFMIVSGYLIYNKMGNWSEVKPRITRWFIPISTFALIYWVVGHYAPSIIHFRGFYDVSLINYISFEITTGFSGIVLWYIWTLMICYLFTLLIERYKLQSKIPLWSLVLGLMIVINIIPFNLLGLSTFKWYGIFFFIGYLIRHYQNSKLIKTKGKAVYICLILFPVAGYLTNWMIDYQYNGYLGAANIVTQISEGDYAILCVMILMALLGSGFVYSLVKLNRLKCLDKGLAYLGKRSVGIYLLHVLFVGITSNVILSSILALVISLTLYELLSRIGFTKKYMFGSIG